MQEERQRLEAEQRTAMQDNKLHETNSFFSHWSLQPTNGRKLAGKGLHFWITDLEYLSMGE